MAFARRRHDQKGIGEPHPVERQAACGQRHPALSFQADQDELGNARRRRDLAGERQHDALPRRPAVGLAATATHTLGYLVVMGLLAVCVYEWLGLRLLRTHWVNLDVAWSVALIATAVLTPFV